MKASLIDGRLLEVLDRAKTALPATTTMIGFAGAPWTVASYMIEGGASKEFLKVKSWALADLEEFQRLIDILIDATVAYLSAQIGAGAEVLQIFDSWMERPGKSKRSAGAWRR